MTTVAIVDYGRGNVRSVYNACAYLGVAAVITDDAAEIDRASHILLPGVGAFGDAMAALGERGLPEILHRQVFEKGKPFLGICVGMQVLAARGFEHGEHAGLGWLEADVVRLDPGPDCLKIPHMGWNGVEVSRDHPLFDGLGPDARTFYFVHSYHVVPKDPAWQLGLCTYGGPFTAAIAKDNIAAVQFHPEKSQDSGIDLLDNFVGWNP